MDISGYSEKGLKRKLAVQTLFGKIYYLSEVRALSNEDLILLLKFFCIRMISDVLFPLVVIDYLLCRSLHSWITVLSNSFFSLLFWLWRVASPQVYSFKKEGYLLLISHIGIPSFWIRHCIFSLTILAIKSISPSVGLFSSLKCVSFQACFFNL